MRAILPPFESPVDSIVKERKEENILESKWFTRVELKSWNQNWNFKKIFESFLRVSL